MGAGPETAIRPATLADVPAIRAILTAHDNDSPVTEVDIVGPYVRHFIEQAIALVTERRGEVVAYGAALDAGDTRQLADLFVRPDLLGQGIGRPLLEAVFGNVRRRTTFASDDPRAIPLYVRAGMVPLWPLLILEGSSNLLEAPRSPVAVESADPVRLSELERDWTGVDRRLEHIFWASQAQGDAFVVWDAGEPIALAYARARQASQARAVDRMVIRPGVEPLQAILVAIRRAGQGGPVEVPVLGPNPALAVLLAAGFRIHGRDQFMASDPDPVDPARLLPNSGML